MQAWPTGSMSSDGQGWHVVLLAEVEVTVVLRSVSDGQKRTLEAADVQEGSLEVGSNRAKAEREEKGGP